MQKTAEDAYDLVLPGCRTWARQVFDGEKIEADIFKHIESIPVRSIYCGNLDVGRIKRMYSACLGDIKRGI